MKIVASDRSESDYHGWSVSISGHFAIVGAYKESEDANGENNLNWAGSAYILEKDELGYWNQVQKIVASDRDSQDHFGNSASISGNYSIVGAITEDEVDVNNVQIIQSPGAAYIFEKDNSSTWNRVEKLLAPIRRKNAHSGISFGVSGNFAIVGAEWETHDELEADSLGVAGAAYLYVRDDLGSWSLDQKIVPSDRALTDLFGSSVGVSGDMAIVGSYLKTEVINEIYYGQIGASYIFKRNGSGTWEEMTKLSASDGSDSDNFGWAVDISGNYAIISSYTDDEDEAGTNPIDRAGSAYVFSYCSDVAKNNQETICHGDSIMLGGEYQLEASTFYDTLRAYTGCDSGITTVLTVNVVKTGVTASESSLTANAASGSYQWIDCSTNAELQGETSQSFSPTISGNYAVELTQNGCVDTSYCYTFTMVGIGDIDLE